MRSSHRSEKARRAGRTRLTIISAIAACSLILCQAFVAAAGTTSDPRGRDDGTTSDTTVVQRSTGGSSAPITSRGQSSSRLGPLVPIVTPNGSSDLEGLVGNGDPSNNGDWTDGNLCAAVPKGQCWKELDNVPHRILFSGLTGGTEYFIDVNIEFNDGSHTGYDDLNNVVGQSGISSGPTSVSQSNVSCGGKTCKQFRITFTPSGSTAEIRFTAHLAIGAHLWNGSNLSVELASGNETVPLPVNKIVFDLHVHKFNDLNGNGVLDTGEPGLSGWAFTLFPGTSCGGNAINLSPNANPVTTDANGDATFTGITGTDADQQGNLSVQETTQTGWQATTPTCQTTQAATAQTSTLNFGNQQLAPALTLTKTGASTVAAGQNITWTITVANGGNAAANNVQLTDTLPAGFTFVSSNPDATGSPATPPFCTNSGSTVNCNLGLVGANSQAQVTITASAPNTCGPFMNSVSGTFGTGTTIPGSPATSGGNVTGCAAGGGSPSSIVIVKGGPALAHIGDTITYTFAVKLGAGSPPLTNVTVVDPICNSAPVLGSKTGGDLDGTLESGETWNYSCLHLVTATDPDPLPNTATASGTDANGTTVSDQDSHVVDLIHPAINIVKSAKPQTGSPGATIVYTYEITNVGDVDLVNISVDDNVIGHVCDIPLLHPKDSVTCTASFVIPANANIKIDNIGVAVGQDELGVPVRDEDTARITVVLGVTITPNPPGGVAFTGTAAVVPLTGVALLLFLVGSGLLWAGRKRGDNAPGTEQ
jgi:uncharacterized repeat protein (TIGR01451 family)